MDERVSVMRGKDLSCRRVSQSHNLPKKRKKKRKRRKGWKGRRRRGEERRKKLTHPDGPSIVSMTEDAMQCVKCCCTVPADSLL